MGSAQWVASTEQGKSRPPAWQPRSQVGSILHISNATRCRGHYQNMLLFARSATTLHATAMEWHVMISAADGGSKCAVPCRGSLVQGCMRPGSDFMTRQAMPSDDTGLHPGPLILHILCLSATILHALLPVMPVGMGRSPGLASKGHSLTASVCWVAGVTVRPRLQACPQPQGNR